MHPTAVVTILVLAAMPRAQQGGRECPFASPQLTATDPNEVAWAAENLDAATAAAAAPRVRAALARVRSPRTEAEQVAVLFLLHAIDRYGIAIPPAELRFECPDFARIAHIVAQVRSATEQGNELLALFQSLDPATEPAWEYVGGTLALRGQRTFAIEVRTRLRPRLRLTIGPVPALGSLVTPDPIPVPLVQDMPPAPRYGWRRDDKGVGPEIVGTGGPLGAFIRPRPLPPKAPPPPLDVVYIERAQLRWLARLAQLEQPAGWPHQFHRAVKEAELAELPTIAAAAEQTARAALTEADAALRTRFQLPERLQLPELEVVVDDRRSPAEQKSAPLPPLK